MKLAEAKNGFVLLSRRWVVERSFGWMARFRRLARDYERLPDTLKGLHFLAFAICPVHGFLSLKCITRSKPEVVALFNAVLGLNRHLEPDADPQDRLYHFAQFAL